MNSQPDFLFRLIPISIILVGLLTAAVCVPLILGKVPPNSSYGMRTKLAYSSPENWYRINRSGGAIFCAGGILIAIWGLTGLLLPQEFMVRYGVTSAVVVLALILLCAALVLRQK